MWFNSHCSHQHCFQPHQPIMCLALWAETDMKRKPHVQTSYPCSEQSSCELCVFTLSYVMEAPSTWILEICAALLLWCYKKKGFSHSAVCHLYPVIMAFTLKCSCSFWTDKSLTKCSDVTHLCLLNLLTCSFLWVKQIANFFFLLIFRLKCVEMMHILYLGSFASA